MQVVIHAEDFREAPAEVRNWIVQRLWLPEPQADIPVDKKPTSKVIKAEAKTDVKEEEVTIDSILTKAVELIEAKGEETLAEILTKVGIKRVKECPPEKYSQLLTEIALHV